MEKSLKEICTIAIGINYLENNYTFYKNGMIKRRYDESILDYGLVEWINPTEINNTIKRQIIKHCESKYKSQICEILEFNLRIH